MPPEMALIMRQKALTGQWGFMKERYKLRFSRMARTVYKEFALVYVPLLLLTLLSMILENFWG